MSSSATGATNLCSRLGEDVLLWRRVGVVLVAAAVSADEDLLLHQLVERHLHDHPPPRLTQHRAYAVTRLIWKRLTLNLAPMRRYRSQTSSVRSARKADGGQASRSAWRPIRQPAAAANTKKTHAGHEQAGGPPMPWPSPPLTRGLEPEHEVAPRQCCRLLGLLVGLGSRLTAASQGAAHVGAVLLLDVLPQRAAPSRVLNACIRGPTMVIYG